MSDKHPAEVWADWPQCPPAVAHMLRAIPALEETIAQQRRIIDALMVGAPEDGTTPVIQRIVELEAELERERMRLVACGVVAMSDTVESAAQSRQMLPEYKSASCDDVARRVDECIALRAERDALRAEVTRWSTTAAVIEAERNELRADADRYRGLRAVILAQSPEMRAEDADADVDANLAERKQQ